METPYDIKRILELMPHRYPFLLVDRVISITPGESIVALKNVTINEPYFQGHFPSHPVMPGVMIVEAMAQTGGILAFESQPERLTGAPVYFTGIDRVRFRRMVIPGDQLVFNVELLKNRSNTFKMKGTATVDNNLAAEAELMAIIGEKP